MNPSAKNNLPDQIVRSHTITPCLTFAWVVGFCLLFSQIGRADGGSQSGPVVGTTEQFALLKKDFLHGTPIPSRSPGSSQGAGLIQELVAVQIGRLPNENPAAFLERIDQASEWLRLTLSEGVEVRALYGRRLKPESSLGRQEGESLSALPQDRAKAIQDRARDTAARLGHSVGTEAPPMGIGAFGSANAAQINRTYRADLAKIHTPPPPPIQSRNVKPVTLPPLQQNPALPQECKYWIFGCKDEPGVRYEKVPGTPYLIREDGSTTIAPQDISQGDLGDCYYLASLAVIAKKYPEKIREMVRQNEDGTFSVIFYRPRAAWEIWKPDYERVEVRVDNNFPMGPFQRPAYAKGNGTGELWPMVAEKAYARYKGSFDAMGQGGLGSDVLEEITGHPSETRDASAVSLDLLESWDTAGKVIVVGTKAAGKPMLESLREHLPEFLSKRIPKMPDPMDDRLYEDQHLVPQHEYWVESVDKNRKTVTLANPWGWDHEHVTLTEEEFQRALRQVFYVDPIR